MSKDSELIKAIGIAQKVESQIPKSALNSFSDYVDYGYKAINTVVKIMGTIGQYTYNFIENTGVKKITIGIIEDNTILKDWYETLGFIHTGTKEFDSLPFTVGFMELAL